MATRCAAIVSDEQDEGEVYRLYKPQRYADGAMDGDEERQDEAAIIVEMTQVLCKPDCVVGSGQGGKKPKKKHKKKHNASSKDKKKKKQKKKNKSADEL